MRCVSKCFVGKVSFRMYTILLLGMAAGFALSTIFQSLNYATIQRTAGQFRKIVDYSELSRTTVRFSNLEEAEIDPNIDLGYDYERMEQEEQQIPESNPQQDAMFDTPTISVDDSKQKQREYVNDNWQGRNVRETNNEISQSNKLSDELAPRQAVLIVVITSMSQLMSQTLAIQGTWAVEAPRVIYFTGEVQTMPHLPHGMVVVQLEGIDDKQSGWDVKEYATIKYLIEHYLDHVDWFLVVGDEAYVVTSALQRQLNQLDASLSVYMGRPTEGDGDSPRLCRTTSGVAYSRGLLERLRPYLPLCWPGRGEMHSLTGCLSVMGLKCTLAKEVSFSGRKTGLEYRRKCMQGRFLVWLQHR